MDYKKKIDFLKKNLKNFKILIMGLPGSGKTTLAQKLSFSINAKHLNADEIRKKYNDWDFSVAGRNRQSKRMKDLSIKLLKDYKIVLADFICPSPKTRKDFNADYIIWMDTINKGRFEDTNKMFIPPKKYDFKVNEKNADFFVEKIVDDLINKTIKIKQ